MNKKQRYSYGAGAALVLLVVLGVIGVMRGRNAARISGAKDFNLLVITLDTTRADHIGAYGHRAAKTPHLDRLAQTGIMFTDCYAPVPLTLPSHCSIFTGRTPLAHQVRDNGAFFLAQQETTLAEKFKEQKTDAKTFAVIASFVLMSKFGLNQGFDVYDDSLKNDELMSAYELEIPAQQVYAKFNRWFKTQDNTTGSFFAWVHFYDCHSPYNAPKEFQNQFDASLSGRYDAELAYVDVYVGKIITDLKNAGLLEKTLVVIVGDHGEAFGEHGEVGHAVFCYQENLKVPLIFFNTHLFPQPRRPRNRVNLIDIMPTLLDIYGIKNPATLQGKSFVSLLAGDAQSTERTFYMESMHGQEEMGWAPLTGIIDGPYKYISLPEPELYDIVTDPGEKDNLFFKKNPLARSLDAKLQNLIKTLAYAPLSPGGKGQSQRHLTEEDKKSLRSLGYLSAFSGKTDTIVDPKKGIRIKNQMDTIEKDITQGRLDQAEAQLNAILAGPATGILPQHFDALHRLYQKTNRPDRVIANWQKAIIAFPRNTNFKFGLATQFLLQKQWPEAEKEAQSILLQDDKFTRAYILIGNIREAQNRDDEALALLEKARKVEPQNVMLKIAYAKLLGKTNRMEESRQLCTELLADPTITAQIEIKSKLGVALTVNHQDEAAFKLLKELTDGGHGTAEDWDYLGILYYRQANFPKALAAYQQSITLENNTPQTYNNMATLYLTLFQQDRSPRFYALAMEGFNKALALDPNHASSLNGRGSALSFAKRFREALQDWQRALQVKPSFIDVYFNLGVTYLQLNNKKDALAVLTRCKAHFYAQLPLPAQQRLDRLISQASGS